MAPRESQDASRSLSPVRRAAHHLDIAAGGSGSPFLALRPHVAGGSGSPILSSRPKRGSGASFSQSTNNLTATGPMCPSPIGAAGVSFRYKTDKLTVDVKLDSLPLGTLSPVAAARARTAQGGRVVQHESLSPKTRVGRPSGLPNSSLQSPMPKLKVHLSCLIEDDLFPSSLYGAQPLLRGPPGLNVTETQLARHFGPKVEQFRWRGGGHHFAWAPAPQLVAHRPGPQPLASLVRPCEAREFFACVGPTSTDAPGEPRVTGTVGHGRCEGSASCTWGGGVCEPVSCWGEASCELFCVRPAADVFSGHDNTWMCG